MPVTIKVNGVVNSLVHKGSNGISTATIPDVCKTPTPGGPVPIPYPNISMSSSLAKGTTTVKADGGNMIAIKGSEFSISSGDEPGTVGGVVSNTFKKESTWITYSFDVKMDGANACRFTDKKFQNHQNTVDMMGEIQAPAVVMNAIEEFFDVVCPTFCELVKRKNSGEKLSRGETWTRKLNQELSKDSSKIARLAKIGANFERSAVVASAKGMANKWGRKAITKFGKSFGAKLITKAIPGVNVVLTAMDIYDAASLVKQGYDLMRVRPDFVIESGGEKLFGDVKFPGDSWGPGQKESYKALNNGTVPLEINEENCAKYCK